MGTNYRIFAKQRLTDPQFQPMIMRGLLSKILLYRPHTCAQWPVTRKRLSRLTMLMLWAQRYSWVVPQAIRSAARNLLRIYTLFDGQRLVDDWSAPLFARGPTPLLALGTETSIVRDMLLTASNHIARPLVTNVTSKSGIHRRLRCLIFTQVLDAGGLDEFVAFLARRLPALGVEATIMHDRSLSANFRTSSRLAETLRSEGVSVIDASPKEGRQWLAVHRPDVISAHAPSDWVLEAAGALNIPVVETLHGAPTPLSTDWSKEVSRSRNVTLMVAVSELVRRQYLRGNPDFAANAVITIPNGYNDTHRVVVDRAKARVWLGLKEEFLFVSLARHTVQKNSYGLVTAFSEVAHLFPEAHLLIAGRMDDRTYTQQVMMLRDRLPESRHIHLRDNLPNPSILLSAADGFVLNSFYEGWSLASMEALCAGLPVVISDVGGAREQVGMGKERGYVVSNPLGDPETVSWERAGRERFRPQKNKDALVAAMTSIIRKRDYWVRVRSGLVEESCQRFSAQTCAEQHAKVLKSAAARNSGEVILDSSRVA